MININIKLERGSEENRAWLNGQLLNPTISQAHINHIPAFCRRFLGSGPSQLALGICLELFGKHLAMRVYHQFKARYVATWSVSGKYQIDLVPFWMEVVRPEAGKAIEDWAYDMMRDHVFEHQVFLAFAFADTALMQAVIMVDDSERSLSEIEKLCETTGWRYEHTEGFGWVLKAKFPVTHTVALLMMKDLEQVFNEVSEKFKKAADAMIDFSKKFPL